MSIVCQYMGVMKEEKKRELSEIYSQLIFPKKENEWSMEIRTAWDNVKWTTLYGVTFVTMWDEEHLLSNICLAMILEIMGIGPSKYCIINNTIPKFETKVLLLMNYLSPKKMCFYPPQNILEGPFANSPWKELGNVIKKRQLKLRHPLVRAIFYTQRFAILFKTRLEDPSPWIEEP